MKILHLATFLQGGAGRVIANLALAQRSAGQEVVLVASRTGAPGYGNYDAYLDALRAAGVDVHLVDSMFHRDYPANLRVVAGLDRLLPRGMEPDVIHAHAAIPAMVGALYAGARRTPMTLMATMHGWGLAKSRSQADTDVALLNLMDVVAVPSRHAAAHLAQLSVDAGRIRRVPYGVGAAVGAPDEGDERVLRSMRQAREDGALVVACVGTIGERKNQALLVDALAWLRRPGAVHAVFVGDGDASGLLASARRRDVLRSVDVRGYSPHARLIAREADLLVLPSRSEGQPIAILEAFADGVPVAVSRAPELTELVEHRVTGLHFDGEDPVALARTLEMFALMPKDDRAAFGARARARYDEEFTAQRMARAYAELYERQRAERGQRAEGTGQRLCPVPSF